MTLVGAHPVLLYLILLRTFHEHQVQNIHLDEVSFAVALFKLVIPFVLCHPSDSDCDDAVTRAVKNRHENRSIRLGGLTNHRSHDISMHTKLWDVFTDAGGTFFCKVASAFIVQLIS